ncbi:cell cycle checkpoint protein RAD17 isoform X1 [Hydra vulgaris]|uniref:cell cycle checkpoint protein RAD17 isoform X1 n=1 Tax=Hydra vulgaris TaxID=6087 RepID=UPI001F5ED61E|nr:cell cycle checkpoint protein RAD17 [Hydra vulgaris]
MLQRMIVSNKRKCDWISSSFDELPSLSINTTRSKQNDQTVLKVAKKPILKRTEAFDQWVEKYKPQTLSDLSVNRKKVIEVEQWLKSHFNSDQTKSGAGILLLTGPSGCGKTATINVLANQMKFVVKEWINPTTNEYQERSSSNWREFLVSQDSQSQQFTEFLLRANRYNQVAIFGDIKNENLQKKVVLIEDLPNFALHKPEKFHNILREYLAGGRSPIIIIMSDGHSSESVHLVFPKHIQVMLNIKVISFNSVSMTALTKTMNSIIEKEMSSSNITIPSKDTCSMLATASNGDIRSCINSLQFLCTNCFLPKSKNIEKNNSKGRKYNSHKNKDGSGTLINCKDSSLFLFRALGKILYCKRLNEVERFAFQLNPTQKSLVRMELNLDPEDVFMRTQITSEMFLLYIHENYPDFFNSVDDIACASDYLCDSDVMNGLWTANSVMCDYSASVGIRGVMFTNTQMQSITGTVAGGWRPLHKPEWFQRFKTLHSRLKCSVQTEKRYPALELYTEVLPYMAKCDSNVLRSFERDIACFQISRHPQRISLGTDQDDYNSIDESNGTASNGASKTTFQQGVETIGSGLQEEDEEIEDFDD